MSLALFELVTIAGAAALLVTAYRLARSGSVVLAVALAAPFLGLALVLAGPDPRPDAVPIARATSILWAASADTRVLTVLLAAAIPIAVVAALVRGAREQTETHSATRELTEGMLADHLARGERARIARELHNVVAHHISMIAVQAETGRLTTPGLPDAGAQRFAAIGDTARAGLTEMRRLLGVLREDAEQGKETGPDLEPAALERPDAGRAGAGPASAAGSAPARRPGGRGTGSIGQRGQAHHVRAGDPARPGRGTGRLPHRPGGPDQRPAARARRSRRCRAALRRGLAVAADS